MGFDGTIQVFPINPSLEAKQQMQPTLKIVPEGSKAQVAAWSYLDKYIVSGHEDGHVALFSPESGEEIHRAPAHDGVITDLQMSADATWFLTSSKDKTAQVGGHLFIACTSLC